jgi:hypothetical protein
MRLKITRWLPALVAVIAVFAITAPVLAAIAQPDDLSIEGVWVYRNCREENDQLYLVLCDRDYSVTGEPSQGADETYMVRLLDGDDTLDYTYPVAYHNDGYDMGVAALYFDASEAPDWEGVYTMELLGNPFQEFTGGVPSDTVTSPNFDIWQDSEMTTIQTMVEARIIWLANQLEDDWSEDMVSVSDTGEDVLTSYAAGYFVNVVPYFTDIAPNTYPADAYMPSETVEPDIPPDEAGTDYADALEDAIIGTPLDLTDLATDWGVSRGPLTAFIYYGVVAFGLIVLARRIGSYKPVMLLSVPCVIVGAFVGVPLEATILAGFISLGLVAYVIFYKPSTA